jgi:hypothetical protein
MATPPPTDDSSLESIRIGAGHPQYVAVLNKRFNKRFTAGPDYVRPAASTGHVLAAAVQEAVNDRQDSLS